jgi:ribosomal protein L2
LVKDKNKTQIYTRTPAGSHIKELKVVSVLRSDIVNIEAFIDNINDYPKWQANIACVKVLRTVDSNTQYIYFATDMPWPISNRDIVILSKIEKNMKTLRFKSKTNLLLHLTQLESSKIPQLLMIILIILI